MGRRPPSVPSFVSASHLARDPVFVLLSFEGPDPYSRAGGIATRVTGLAHALSDRGFETHLLFIGDPVLPGHEVLKNDRLHLHRWCQWISRYHPAGVYDGEEGKMADWTQSLPGWVLAELVSPVVARGGSVIVLGEEWHTASSVVALSAMCSARHWEGRVHCIWNANNTFGFHRIDWAALSRASAITTVSKYMKHVMWGHGVDARVIPNGIDEQWLRPVEIQSYPIFGPILRERTVLVKMARWDPNKRWLMAIDAVAELKRWGWRPLLLARGGDEPHGAEVLQRSKEQDLSVSFVRCESDGVVPLVTAISGAQDADIVVMHDYLSEEQRRFLLQAAHAVLANSGVEPFGLVGLETMAVGGIALVGSTGEDYVTPGHDAIALQTSDSLEIVHHVLALRSRKSAARQMRRAARRSAARFTWQAVLDRHLLPFVSVLHVGAVPSASEHPSLRLAGMLARNGTSAQPISGVVTNPTKIQGGGSMDRESAIVQIAYRIWEEEGRPEGRTLEHWMRAEAQWQQQDSTALSADPMAVATPADAAPKQARRSRAKAAS